MPAVQPRRTARRRGFALALLLGTAAAAASTACAERPRPAVAHKGPVIALTDSILRTGGADTVRFGRLRTGEIAMQRLWIENRTDRPAVIVACGTSCGCTRLEFDSQPILPGGAQCATLWFDSRGEYGWQLKRLDISLAGAARPLRVFVEAEIE